MHFRLDHRWRSHTKSWRHIDFPRWRSQRCKSTACLRIGRLRFKKLETFAYQISMRYRWGISIHGWDITTPGFWKQTDAISKFCFRFLFWLLSSSSCHCASACQISPELTSYRFSKTAATVSQIYFRFRVWWRCTVNIVENYVHTKFR